MNDGFWAALDDWDWGSDSCEHRSTAAATLVRTSGSACACSSFGNEAYNRFGHEILKKARDVLDSDHLSLHLATV